jgi:hypothetical protein
MSPRKLIATAFGLALLILASASGSQALASATTPAATSVSANWAGYVAVPPASAGSRFSSVSGTWRQPSATCSAGQESFSAVWVGLGGYSASARALEQIGTDTDCTRSGGARYSTWYELLPAGPVNLKLKVHPGDELSASVTVKGHGVTLRIADLTTGERFSRTQRVASVDTSSAEWIVEAPSACVSSQSCEILPLTDFGEVPFAAATATADAHTGPITDPDWTAGALELQQQAFAVGGSQTSAHELPERTLIAATPSASAGALGSFAVSWREQSTQIEQPSRPTLPGFGGGPP